MKKSFQHVILIFFSIIFCITFTTYINSSLLYKNHQKVINFYDIKKLEYIIEPKFEKNSTKLNVDLYIELKNKPNILNMLYLHIPNKFGFAENLHRDIKNLNIVESEAIIVHTNEPYTKIIKNILTNIIHINYTVTCSVKNLKNMNGQNDYYRPILTKNYFHLIGYNFIVFPCWKYENQKRYYTENDNLNIILKWKNMPTNWKFANSHGINNPEQNLFISISNFIYSIYIAGDFIIKKFTCKNYPVFLVMLGKSSFQYKEFVEIAKKAINTQREFWNDYNFPHFLITILPLGKNHNYGGVSLLNSSVIFLGEKKELKSIDSIYCINHECFHTWNKGKIANYTLPWFSEGFTDYYAYNFALNTKLLTFHQYINIYNKTLYNLYISSFKDEKFPYYLGHVLAHNWNSKIKNKTNGKFSLDNIMHDIINKSKNNNKKITTKLINDIIKNYIKEGINEDIKKYIEKKQTIIPDKNALGSCYTLNWIKIKKGNKEFDIPQYILKSNPLIY
ncbi:hypothetical protein KAT08_00625 [Candidatus Babeliales bacterium]|nr:hypothetical protein [Candidatus Babeliales bacterium]